MRGERIREGQGRKETREVGVGEDAVLMKL